ncbi:CaiB/BaiF CoA transferase family protein [Streptomyces sp. NPDC048425]|uniref:CaiB/BaiF CoA transferase family protein n=2 Tax=unclassified Streptomyces TaxID=2593676 RepID=UPI0037239958
MTSPDHDTRNTGPLSGLRVVEIAGIGPSPFAAMLLADLGADVLRVDRKGAERIVPARYDLLNRNRRNIALDLKHPRGLETALQLAERADVLLEGFRPGVAERLGLGPDACLERNSRLVYGRMTGWGQDGPLAHSAGHDITYVALTGAPHSIGRADGPPQIPLNLVGDFGGGSLYLAFGVLAALWERGRSGQGQVVDAAVVDGAVCLTTLVHAMSAAGLWSEERGTNRHDSGTPYYDVYETSDGGWMAVGALELQFYAELVQLLQLDGDPALPDRDDRSRWPELRTRFTERFRSRTREEWTRTFEGTDACVAPVLTPGEAPAHPHLAERTAFTELDGVLQPSPAPRFSRTAARLTRHPAAVGEHTREALMNWGIDNVDSLLDSGAAHQA